MRREEKEEQIGKERGKGRRIRQLRQTERERRERERGRGGVKEYTASRESRILLRLKS